MYCKILFLYFSEKPTIGIARAVYDRLFKWLIEKCNETLIDPTMKKVNIMLWYKKI